MVSVKELNSEVYIAREPIVSVGPSEIEFLKKKVNSNERKRIRLCAHKSTEDRLHEMFIVLTNEAYFPPSKHLNKDESLHVVEGLADYIFFDEQGSVTEVIPLGDYASGRRFYCRVPEFSYHAIIIRSDILVIHETTQGPFRKHDTAFAPWGPEVGDETAVARFFKRFPVLANSAPGILPMTPSTPEAYYSDAQIVKVGPPELAFFKERVHLNERKRVRLCAHKNTEDELHEMFVLYLKETYVRPNKHLHKDESLHIIEGEADFIFFDEGGNVTGVVHLGDYASGRQFYVRVPDSVYHTLIIKSDSIVIHETTPGPFNRSDTLFAPWAPEEGTDSVANYIKKLAAAAENFNVG
jgi:cupin fold WbuC family metalloprotein